MFSLNIKLKFKLIISFICIFVLSGCSSMHDYISSNHDSNTSDMTVEPKASQATTGHPAKADSSSNSAETQVSARNSDNYQSLTIKPYRAGNFTNISSEKPQAFIITEPQQWDEFWHKHSPNTLTPPIDFAWNMIIAVTDTIHPSGGYAVQITEVGIYTNNNTQAEELLVVAELSEPGEGCMTSMQMTAPFAMVLAPKNDLDVQLEIIQNIQHCY